MSTTCSVSDGHRRLRDIGLIPTDGTKAQSFETWVWPNGDPEMISYADVRGEFFELTDVEAIEASAGQHP